MVPQPVPSLCQETGGWRGLGGFSISLFCTILQAPGSCRDIPEDSRHGFLRGFMILSWHGGASHQELRRESPAKLRLQKPCAAALGVHEPLQPGAFGCMLLSGKGKK